MADNDPRETFLARKGTVPLKKESSGFWEASNAVARWGKLGLTDVESTFDATCHFIQAASGTGVSLEGGILLTCAHVIAAEDDENADGVVNRVGRQKLVMFPRGKRLFLCRCVAVCETLDGDEDVALLQLEEEVRTGEEGEGGAPPVAALADKAAEVGDWLFAVGNPSNIDLETLGDRNIDFDPPTWHCSVGACVCGKDVEGYVNHSCWTYWGHSG